MAIAKKKKPGKFTPGQSSGEGDRNLGKRRNDAGKRKRGIPGLGRVLDQQWEVLVRGEKGIGE